MRLVGLLGIAIALGWLFENFPSAPKPREHPLWCHNAEHIHLSGVCSKIKGLEWSI